ncbi:MAG: DNA (cytosine-5-)-methyltransferase [Cytophagaceae bacterium]|nr:DNA (cytosine-5-)-methyltransferase [Cytophagaceae bacterium]
MKHISLFSGIGGFDLASEWMGWENIASCEIADFPNKILEYYWPKAKHHRNIYDTDFTIYRGKCDILTGGFPCQPFSVAGKRKGTEDDRHLWPEMLRAIREIQPLWIVGENVLGIVNWSKGLVFEQVQIDLEDEGYKVQTFVLPACGVGASHRRYRTWFIAYSESKQSPRKTFSEPIGEKQREFGGMGIKTNDEFDTDTNGIGSQRPRRAQESCYSEQSREREEYRAFNDGQREFISPICRGYDGLSKELYQESLKGLGNSIVPQLVYPIFKSIEQYEILFNEPVG